MPQHEQEQADSDISTHSNWHTNGTELVLARREREEGLRIQILSKLILRLSGHCWTLAGMKKSVIRNAERRGDEGQGC